MKNPIIKPWTTEIQTIQKQSVESLWMDRLKCKYPQGLNWAKYDPTKRYKLLTPLHGEHIAQKMHLQHSPITDDQAKQYKTTINQIFNN